MTSSPDPTPDADALTRESLTNRTGYDERFLGPAVPLPRPVDPGIETVILPYTHFSVVFRPDRRLAASTGVVINGQQLIEADRTNDWRFDPRLPDGKQAGDPVYKNNPLDKGHLVRRLDPVWGTASETSAANSDTFHYTNAAPQMDLFNQGKKLWQGLEDFLLNHAKTFHRKLAVFTGPVLEDSDPPYRGIQVPLRFWKVAAFMQDGELAATAYVLDQSPDLSRDAAARAMADAARAGDPPPLGAFRTFQVPVADVAEITGLDLGPLPAADRLPPHVRAAKGWTQLERFEDIVV
ncbi:DNA/RNA non-specific endonuclease [Streptomyces cyanogenus]|uniref:DNA/RNA non-specific endonuclease n=1 Tax=Streptomyces cyanogenus TaxID=80860 RepID=A0ABX7U2G4_STRCY|nr:DNA/RNA non-specific endonuclease [Streptomyces cyanogenus]QTD95742.1 DNA/RNA non-specific endonuclease [Streptomyces cyanogenus]QTE03248.1 DNA/RNA non-specific endonuclease [Streptomyces cyanogenus]